MAPNPLPRSGTGPRPRKPSPTVFLIGAAFLTTQIALLAKYQPMTRALAPNQNLPVIQAGSARPQADAGVVRRGVILSSDDTTHALLGARGLSSPAFGLAVNKSSGRVLYFSTEEGNAIGALQAPGLDGPWTIAPAETIHKEQINPRDGQCGCPTCGSISGPSLVRYSENEERIILSCNPWTNVSGGVGEILRPSFWSSRPLGSNAPWTPGSVIDGLPSHSKLFRYDGEWYALAKTWSTKANPDTKSPHEYYGGCVFKLAKDWSNATLGPLLVPRMRHSSLLLVDDSTLLIVYSRIGDIPEHLLFASIDLSKQGLDWTTWTLTSLPSALMAPSGPREGSSVPKFRSMEGPAPTGIRELRDPTLAVSSNGFQLDLVYVAAGESNVLLASIPNWRSALVENPVRQACSLYSCFGRAFKNLLP